MGDTEIKERAFKLASQVISYKVYQDIVEKRGSDEGKFKISIKDIS